MLAPFRAVFVDPDVHIGILDLPRGDIIEGLLYLLHVFRAIAVYEFVNLETALGAPLIIHPRESLGQDVVGPHRHMACLQDERQTVVAPAHHLCHLALADAEDEVVEENCPCNDDRHHSSLPYPGGYARILAVGIEPFVLDGLQAVVGAQIGIHAVYLVQQVVILRHELVFAIGQVDGLYDQVVCMVLPHQPLQRHGVPHDDTVVIRADSLDGLLHVLVGDNLFRPTVVID